MLFIMTITSKYGSWTETFSSLEGARLRAAAIYGDCAVRIVDQDGKQYTRHGW